MISPPISMEALKKKVDMQCCNCKSIAARWKSEALFAELVNFSAYVHYLRV